MLPFGLFAALAIVGSPAFAAADADLDGDGWTIEDGDCDDDDDRVWPGAPELCATRDLDCDGVVTWDSGAWMPSSVAALEGTTLRLSVEPLCEGELRWTVPGLLYCEAAGLELECETQDDYHGVLSATLLGPDGQDVEVQSATFDVSNVAPLATPGTGWLADGVSVVHPGQDLASAIWVTDPGADTHQFALRDAPPGMTIASSGYLEWQPSRGELGDWAPTVVVTDDDGGQGSLTFPVAVEATSCGGCGSQGAALLWGLGGLAGLKRRRRPRSGAELVAEG